MNMRSQATNQSAAKPSLNSDKSSLLQRKCDCGNAAGLTGMCSECQSKLSTKRSGRVAQTDSAPILHELIQPKLTIGQPNDKYEQEADRIANQVMTAPRYLKVDGALPSIQRYIGKITQSINAAPTNIGRVLARSGKPLEPTVRQDLEQRLGHDFSGVRVHTDEAAARSAHDVNARAYTVGQKIVFARQQYAPETSAGRRLLAHELVHTIQQSNTGSMTNPLLQRTIGDGHDLRSPRFAGDPVLEACFDNERLLRFGSRGTAVEKIQQALIDAGFPLPTFGVDGIFKSETQTAVQNYQRSKGLDPDGIIGPLTMGVLDAQFAGGPPAPTPPGPTPVPPSPTPIPPPPTVTIPPAIRSLSTPTSMSADRIPPRVDIPITIGFSGATSPAAPVTLSVEGSGGNNGSVTINGAPRITLTGPMFVNLRGTRQTVAGNAGRLRLVAKRSGTNLAASNVFSVAAIPNSVSFTLQSLVTGGDRGFVVAYTIGSDSGLLADLNGTAISERIQIMVHTGIFASTTTINTSGYILTTSPQVDTHSVGPLAALVAVGLLQLQQTFMFKDDRTGVVNIPVDRSGFSISHNVAPDPAGGFQVISNKNGAAGTALGIASTAGTGTATATQHV